MNIEARLTEIEEELRLGHAEKPEKMLTELLSQMKEETLAEWRLTLESVIDHFQPRRKRQLHAFLERRIEGLSTEVREPAVASGYAVASKTGQTGAGVTFQNDLEELGRKHIFQWGTHYREGLFRHFDVFLERMEFGSDGAATSTIRRCLSEHSHEIFTKGYEHERDAKGTSHLGAVKKSVGGLAQFLELLLEYYSDQVSHTYQQASIVALRALYSAALTGVLEGYAAARFGDERGDSLLSEFPERWGRSLAFLTPSAALEVSGFLETGPFTEGIERSAIPLLESIDRLINKQGEDYFPVPLSGRLAWDDRFLMVEVRAPRSTPRPVIEARAYLDAETASWRSLNEARAQDVALVVAPLKPEVRQFVREREPLANMVVEAGASNPQAVADLAEQVWRQTIHSLRSKRPGKPISHNVARLFPLNEPNLRRSYRVRRTSVRDLLREFDRTNGVRLWCSVRRSGKTMACFGLDNSVGDSDIIPQTCGTGPTRNARRFYDSVRAAVVSGSHLPTDFVEATVAECTRTDGRRKVLIVDEYETLFHSLRAEAEQNSYVRYSVVQPLLNQFVEFTRENLLVFLGQQPDAHFILMDQNQLAPYVRQDPFPLFEYTAGTRAGEFGQLVGKVLTEQIGHDPGFLGALHLETAGHPFLTVNVLRGLVDWLIEERRPYRDLMLFEADFAEFREKKLRPSQMAMSMDYDFFRGNIKDAVSERGYRDNPWLFTVYWLVREISRENPGGLSISRSELPNLLDRIPAPGPLPDQHEILRTASQANFLDHDDNRVGVRIRALGRLAAAIRPGLA